jgi:hypothetical protein
MNSFLSNSGCMYEAFSACEIVFITHKSHVDTDNPHDIRETGY